MIPVGVCGQGGGDATTELTRENFEQVLDGDEMVLIDFWADWCGPCRFFGPVYERVSGKHPDIVFGKVDTEAQPELAAAFGISSIPTLMIVREKGVLYAQPGALREADLERLIEEARSMDLEQVRRHAGEHKRSA